MPDSALLPDFSRAQTDAVRRVMAATHDHALIADLLFLERWEMIPIHGPAAALRVAQIRRANPALAEQVRAEIARARQN
ncbi:MAG: hypothetical protein M0Z28_11045 [Rhodospirillales bacterium]|nr:hypothetical protein [Rhodospirillales bacterium]